MKKYFSYTIMLLLMFFLSIGCKDDKSHITNNNNIPLNLSIVWSTYEWESASGINPSNFSNPYDYMGQEHNDGCNYFLAHFMDLGYIPTNEALLMEEIYTVIEELDIDAGSTETTDTIRAIFNQYVAPMTSLATYPQLVHSYSYDSISAELKLDLLENMIIDTKDSNINYIINYIKTKETPIILSGFYNASEKEDFLIYSSILRFSLTYWYDVEKGLISDFNYLGLGGSATDTIVAVQGLTSMAGHDANWAKASKRSSKCADAQAASFAVWCIDSTLNGIGWGLRQLGNGLVALGNWITDLL